MEQQLQQFIVQHGKVTALEPVAKSRNSITEADRYKMTFEDGAWVIYQQPVVDEDGNETTPFQIISQNTTKADAPKSTSDADSAPPREKDEGGRRYVWTRDPSGTGGAWVDVGPAPLTAAEIAAQRTPASDHSTITANGKVMQYNPETGKYDIEVGTAGTPPQEKDELGVGPSNQEWVVQKIGGRLEMVRNPNYVAPKDPNELTEYQRRQLTLQENQANKPQLVNANPKQETLTVYNPESGEFEGRANPSYDAALAEYDRQKERLATAIQLGNLDAQQAKDELDRWFKLNVDIPFRQSAEARARAAEIRQSQEAQERAAASRAQYEQRRAEAGLQAGQQAVNAELQQLPYMTGPEFGAQFAEGVNSLARGSSAGINFTQDAFQFKKPDLQSIASKATAEALKHISPAAQAFAGGVTQYAQPDYGGINLQPGEPPPAHTSIDINSILAGLGGGGGGGGGAPAAPAQEDIPLPSDEDVASYY